MSSENRKDALIFLKFNEVQNIHVGKWVSIRHNGDETSGFLLAFSMRNFKETATQGYHEVYTGKTIHSRTFRFQGGEVMRVDVYLKEEED